MITPLPSPISRKALAPSPSNIGKLRTGADSRAENDSITIVAIVMPDRAGLRRKLSDANLVSAHERPGSRSADRQNDRTASLTIAGQKNARPSKNSSMPVNPRLKRSTG